MGLLSKAQTVSKRENEKKESGAPESGASSGRTGLLEKAEKHRTKGEPEPEETARKGGLLEEAARILNGEEDKALKEEGEEPLFVEEEAMREGEEPLFVGEEALREGEEPVYEPRGGLLEQAILMKEKEKRGPLAPAEKLGEPETVLMEGGVVTEGLEEAEKPVSEIKEEEEAPVSLSETIEQYLNEKDTLQIIRLFNDVIGKDGYGPFCESVTEILTRLGKGKIGILFVYYKGKYSVECIYPEESYDKKTGKINFRENIKFIKSLKDETVMPLKSGSIKDGAVVKETAKLDFLSPWNAFPFPSGEELPGFIIVGNQPKRPKLKAETINLFTYLSGLFLSKYVLEGAFQRNLDKLNTERNERDALLDLYSYSDRSAELLEEDMLEDAMQNLYSLLEIETAALVTGWGGRGKLKVDDSIGIPKKILSKYRVSKSDRGIKSIIEGREPALLTDAASRIKKLTGKKDEQLKTYIVCPVIFGDEVLGILNVHRMKGASKKLSNEIKSKLKHGTRSIAPYIMYRQFRGLDPFDVLEDLLTREIRRAKRSRQPLHVVMLTIENGKKALKTHGFSRYWGFIEKLYKIIEKRVQNNGVFKGIEWNKTVLLLRKMEDIEANAAVKQVIREFHEIFEGEKKEKVLHLVSSITSFPKESKDLSDILGNLG